MDGNLKVNLKSMKYYLSYKYRNITIEDIEDAIQDAFIHVIFDKNNELEKINSHYFYTSVENKLKDLIRKKRKYIITDFLSNEIQYEEQLHDLNYENTCIHSLPTANTIDFEEIFSKLPIEMFEILFIHFFLDYSFKEISEYFDTKISTIYKRYERAIKRIRKIIGANLHD